MTEDMRPSDREALASLEKKLHLARDHVTAVVRSYKTGYFLYGAGGVGKSYTVLRHLESSDVPYQLYNSRMTAKGLFQTLHHAPYAIEARKAMRRNAVRAILGTVADATDQERAYMEKTGASRADYYRRKREVESGEFDEADATEDVPDEIVSQARMR